MNPAIATQSEGLSNEGALTKKPLHCIVTADSHLPGRTLPLKPVPHAKPTFCGSSRPRIRLCQHGHHACTPPEEASEQKLERACALCGVADFSLRIRIRVCPNVLKQVVGRRERLAARLADMRPLLPPMYHAHVLSQFAGPRVRLAARLADMRPLPRMCPHVPDQVAGLGERLAARLADMRLLPRMPMHVYNQGTGVGERLAARLAHMRPLPRMRPHVSSQVAGRRERFATRLTGIRSLP